jgi:hypothetical protein
MATGGQPMRMRGGGSEILSDAATMPAQAAMAS